MSVIPQKRRNAETQEITAGKVKTQKRRNYALSLQGERSCVAAFFAGKKPKAKPQKLFLPILHARRRRGRDLARSTSPPKPGTIFTSWAGHALPWIILAALIGRAGR